MNSLNKLTFIMVFILVLISSLDSFIPGVRYVKYLIPVVVLTNWFLDKNLYIYSSSVTNPFLFLFVWLVCFIWLANAYGFADLFFIACSMMPFIFIRYVDFDVNKIFIAVVIIFALISLPAIRSNGFAYSIVESTSGLENHTFSFVFGIFAVYFWLTKQFKYFIFCLVICFLTLKRISLLALLLIAFLSLLPFRFDRFLRPSIMVTANLMFVLVAYFVTTDYFNDLCVLVFERSAGMMTQGRNVLYEEMFYRFFDNKSGIVFGVGLGESYSVAASSIGLDVKFNIHSDVLKIFYESGIVLFVGFFALLYRVEGNLKYMALYLNVVLLTDNISTYVFVMFFYFFLCKKIERMVNLNKNDVAPLQIHERSMVDS